MKENIYFETIKCEDYEIFNLEYHNKRVAKTIGLNINLQEYIYPLSEDLLRCKVIYNDFEIINVEYFTYKKRDISSFKLIFDDKISYSSIANIAILYKNTWITSKNSLLNVTTKNRLLEEKFLIEKEISLDMLKKASKIALMNAMIGFDIKENYSFKV